MATDFYSLPVPLPLVYILVYMLYPGCRGCANHWPGHYCICLPGIQLPSSDAVVNAFFHKFVTIHFVFSSKDQDAGAGQQTEGMLNNI